MFVEILKSPWLLTKLCVGAVLMVVAPFIMIPVLLCFFGASYVRDRWIPPTLPDSIRSPRAKNRDPTLGWITTHDGLRVQYRLLESSKGKDAETIVFTVPLGSCGFTMFYPIIAVYGDNYNYLCWDYRGLFNSDEPKQLRRLSVNHHAEDLNTLLNHLNVKKALAVIGHSMGVQVALEFSTLYPERVGHMVLLNGAHGQVFTSAFQPVFRVPMVGDMARSLVNTLISNPSYLGKASYFTDPAFDVVLRVYSQFFGSKLLREILGPNYLAECMREYFGGILGNQKSTANYLRLFRELDAHSVYDHLSSIKVPTLVISGFWDYCTPYYHSMEMARRMPNCTHYCCMLSSHATIMENPERVIEELRKRFGDWTRK
eukprot:Hpha_TRINITY_DN8503_c0_g1::TRINITY_DN8503_c0_g1_i1::g.146302::m.146302